jgi:hypothetical protein
VWTTGVTQLPDSTLPPHVGANFVDVTLRVVVISAAGSLTAFQPAKPHGTSYHPGHGDPIVRAACKTATDRVSRAYDEIIENGGPLVLEDNHVAPHDWNA